MKRRKVVYVAGPFRGKDAWAVEQNVRRAEELAYNVWAVGAVALCPHTNTRFFDGTLTDDIWLEGTMELLRRCDAVILTADWARSSGARGEVEEAQRLGLPVFSSMATLVKWLEDEED